MKSIVFESYGSIDQLKIAELPNPTLKKDMALVRIKYMSVNPRDTVIRSGRLKFLTGMSFPKLTGADFSGEIIQLYSTETRFKIGDEVFGYFESINGGVSASIAAIPIKYLSKKSIQVSHEVASTLGCTYLTALQALRDKGKIKKDSKLLIYGAAGGVGTAAIQMGKYLGAHVTAVSNSKNRDYCMEQGADDFIAYNETDIFTSNQKYDIFFQVFSNKGSLNLYSKAKKLISKDGKFICLMISPLSILKKLFSTTFDFVWVKNKIDDLEEIMHLTEKGILNPQIHKVFPLEDYKSAYESLEHGNIQGKIVIKF